jgi:hypothetical protein
MPAYGSIEHSEPRLSKSKSRMAMVVLGGALLLVAVAGALHFVQFHDSHMAAFGTKLFHSRYDADDHVALQQLSASLDRQLETLNELEAKVVPSHLAAVSEPVHAAVAAHPATAASGHHGPEGKSESFLADIMGIRSPAMQSQSSSDGKSRHSQELGAQPNSSPLSLLSPFLCMMTLALLSAIL